MIIADSNDEFDSFKPMLLTKIIRKLIYIKNTNLRKKIWKFNPHDKNNYTSEHTHKSIIDYINFSMNNNCFELENILKNEHFITQFEGSLMKQSFFDRLFFYFLKFIDNKVPLNPTSQVLLFFRKI